MTTRSIEGSTIAITGGTGSFGSTMTRNLLERGAGKVHIFSRDEAKQDEMRKSFDDDRLRFFLGDVRDLDSVKQAFVDVDFAFHAAALKQVPSCEFFPEQAVLTNVKGSQNVIEAANERGVSSLVLLSTDKAVYPVNAMGMTKALMEKSAQAFARKHPKSGTTVSLTRYGNVMYSRGSVIPLFVNQIRQDTDLTVTEPEMTRFLMSLDESVDLVEHAFLHAEPGDLFVRKAPASTVKVLAKAVGSLLGLDDPSVATIGIRHGEKMHETLLSAEEAARASDEGQYYRVPLDARSLRYGVYVEEGDKEQAIIEDYTSENTERLDIERTKKLLLTIPEMRRQVGATQS